LLVGKGKKKLSFAGGEGKKKKPIIRWWGRKKKNLSFAGGEGKKNPYHLLVGKGKKKTDHLLVGKAALSLIRFQSLYGSSALIWKSPRAHCLLRLSYFHRPVLHVTTHTNTHKHTQTHTHTYTHIHKHTYTNIYTHIHKHTYTNTHMQTQTLTHSHTYMRTLTYTHTYTHRRYASIWVHQSALSDQTCKAANLCLPQVISAVSRKRAHAHTHTHTHIHTRVQRAHAHLHSHTHAHLETLISLSHTHTHTHTHIHTHFQPPHLIKSTPSSPFPLEESIHFKKSAPPSLLFILQQPSLRFLGPAITIRKSCRKDTASNTSN